MEIRDWLLTISMIGHFTYTAWAYVERRGDKTNERLDEMASRIDHVERLVAEVKSAGSAAPTHADLGKVYDAMRDLAKTTNDSISALAGTVNQLVGENRGQTDTLRLILNRITETGLKK